jgi:hypothetical protein
MSNELPAVARNIHLFCKKCDVDRYHVVVAHLDSRSAKVKCEVCGSQKTFRTPSEATRKGVVKRVTGNKPASKAGASRSHAQAWRDLNEKIGADSARAYSLRESFSSQTAIQHPKFGIGYVTASHPDKIDVVFEDSVRSLVHNRPN